MNPTFAVSQNETRLCFKTKNERVPNPWRYKFPHYAILHRVLNMMKDRGFVVGRDPGIEKEYKCISKDYWYGKKGDLEFKAHRFPAGFEIEFFQNVVFKNRHGGYYDFEKYQKMPYMLKLLFRIEAKYIKEFLESLGCIDSSKPIYKMASDKIKYRLVDCCHHPQKSMEEFELTDLDGQTCEGSYNNTDKDGKTIYNGQIKYFRHYNGRLMRGKVYHNINNMWWVIINAYEYTNMADFELFDPTPENFEMRRNAPDRKPKEYLEKLNNLQKLSNKDLQRELKKRGLKVS